MTIEYMKGELRRYWRMRRVPGRRHLSLLSLKVRHTPGDGLIGSDGDRLVGQPARRQAVVNHENTVFASKRWVIPVGSA